jgi:hypothetical protein
MRSSDQMKWLLTVSAAVALMALSSPAVAEPPAMWGGYGHAFVNGNFGTFGALESNLRRPEAIGRDFTLSDIVLGFGGGGKALLAGTVLIGGKGMGWYVPSSSPDSTHVNISGGGGGFELGIAVWNRDHFLLYPYFGGHGYGVDVEIENSTDTTLNFGDDTVAARQTKIYRSSFWVAEFGIGMQRFLFWRTGGFMIGAEGGFLTTLVRGDWEDEAGKTVAGLETLGFSGGFVRLTLGGGGFYFKDGWGQEDD